MVAKVQGVYAMRARQTLGDGLPISPRPEQAVQDQDGVSRSVLFVGKCYRHLLLRGGYPTRSYR